MKAYETSRGAPRGSRRHRASSLLLCFGLPVAGCVVPAGDESPFGTEIAADGGLELGKEGEALWSSAGTQFVPNGTISVCFNPIKLNNDGTWSSVASNDPQVVRLSALIQTTVEDGYEHIPNAQIDFTGWNVCANKVSGTALGQIRVQLGTTGTGAAYRLCTSTGKIWSDFGGPECVGGAGYSPTREMVVGISPDGYSTVASARTAILHEFGHALGFSHERDRSDSTQYYNPASGCVNQAAGTTIGGITVYDPASIMNGTYCHWTPELSTLDQLGLEVVYPRTRVHGIGLRNHSGFITADGLVIRQDNTDSFVSEWTYRGASPKAFQNDGATMSWEYLAGLEVFGGPSGLGFPVAALPTWATSVRGAYYDFATRAHTQVTTGVTRSDRVHAAILVAML